MQTLRTAGSTKQLEATMHAITTSGRAFSMLQQVNLVSDELQVRWLEFGKSLHELMQEPQNLVRGVTVEQFDRAYRVSCLGMEFELSKQLHVTPDHDVIGYIVCTLDHPLGPDEQAVILAAISFDRHGSILSETEGGNIGMNWAGPYVVAHVLKLALSRRPVVSHS